MHVFMIIRLTLILSILILVQSAQAQSDLGISGMPDVGSAVEFVPPVPREDMLPNGLRVVFLKVNDIPTVELNLIIHGGAAMDKDAMAGTAFITAEMIISGSQNSTADDLASRLAVLGSTIGTSVRYDYTQLYSVSLVQNLPQTLQIFAEILTEPLFDTTAFKKKRQSVQTTLLNSLSNPSTITSQTLLASLHGEQSPFPYTVQGRFKNVSSLSVEACKEYYQNYYKPGNATLIVSGNLDYDGVRTLLIDRFSSWKESDTQAIQDEDIELSAPRVVLIDNPELRQALIRVAYKCNKRSTADFEKLLLMNEVFGGGRASRLGRAFYGERVLSPNVVSGISFHKNTGNIALSGSIPSRYVDSALAVMDETIAFITDSLVTDAELLEARKRYTDSFDQEFSTNRRVQEQYQEVIAYGLPLDYYKGYIERFQNVTREDIRTAARGIFRKPRVVVIAGDAKVILPKLQARYIVPVEVLSHTEVMMQERPPQYE
jgi:zinc protease